MIASPHYVLYFKTFPLSIVTAVFSCSYPHRTLVEKHRSHQIGLEKQHTTFPDVHSDLTTLPTQLNSAVLSSYHLLENNWPELSKHLPVLGLHGKVLVARGATGVAALGSCQKLPPPCVTEPMPGSSKADPLLVKAAPINNSSTSEVTDWRRRGKTCTIESAVGEE